MRKFKRMIARANMKRAGYTRLNKKGGDGRSTFAKLWNENPSQFTLKGENYTPEGWEGKLKLYGGTYGSSPYEYLVDENNVCGMADERTQAVKIA